MSIEGPGAASSFFPANPGRSSPAASAYLLLFAVAQMVFQLGYPGEVFPRIPWMLGALLVATGSAAAMWRRAAPAAALLAVGALVFLGTQTVQPPTLTGRAWLVLSLAGLVAALACQAIARFGGSLGPHSGRLGGGLALTLLALEFLVPGPRSPGLTSAAARPSTAEQTVAANSDIGPPLEFGPNGLATYPPNRELQIASPAPAVAVKAGGVRSGPIGSASVPGLPKSIDYRFNSLGFRDRPWETAHPRGTFRVALLGGSFVAGEGLAENDGLARQLEAHTQRPAQPGAPRVECLNFGVRGQGLSEAERMLAEVVAPFSVDLVIFTLVVDRHLAATAIAEEPQVVARGDVLHTWGRWAGSRAPASPRYLALVRHLVRFHAQCRQQRARLALLLVPGGDDRPSQDLEAAVVSGLAPTAIRVVNLRQALGHRPARPGVAAPLPSRLTNPQVHRLAAEELAEVVERLARGGGS